MFKIGSIVALKSHPYIILSNHDSLVIAGDAQGIPPVMAVVETLAEFEVSRNHFSIKQCKCMWYSHKSRKFESDWFLSDQISEIPMKEETHEGSDICPEVGTLARFKTTGLELGKKKSSIDYSGNVHINSRSISSLLYFVAPVLQIIDVKVELKPNLEEKTRKKHRGRSSNQLKCKYFDLDNNKFSEIIIPLEAIEVIKQIEETKIASIHETISSNKSLRITSSKSEIPGALVKPLMMNYRSGLYYLEAFNYLTGQNTEFLLNGNDDIFTECEYALSKLPCFTPIANGLFKVSKINREGILGLNPANYWRIKYQDNNGNLTERTIHTPEIIDTIEEQSHADNTMPQTYLKAFCMLRNASRYFRLDGIKEIVELNIAYIPPSTSDILIDQKGQIAQEAQDTPLS